MVWEGEKEVFLRVVCLERINTTPIEAAATVTTTTAVRTGNGLVDKTLLHACFHSLLVLPTVLLVQLSRHRVCRWVWIRITEQRLKERSKEFKFCAIPEQSIKLTCMEVRIADTSYVGLHLFCRMSRQMPPSAYTFGWNIFDTKRTVGGLFGYSSVNSIVSLKVPSSNGVSCGPKITAFQIMMLLSVGAPDTPVGGSSWSLKRKIGNSQYKKS